MWLSSMLLKPAECGRVRIRRRAPGASALWNTGHGWGWHSRGGGSHQDCPLKKTQRPVTGRRARSGDSRDPVEERGGLEFTAPAARCPDWGLCFPEKGSDLPRLQSAWVAELGLDYDSPKPLNRNGDAQAPAPAGQSFLPLRTALPPALLSHPPYTTTADTLLSLGS